MASTEASPTPGLKRRPRKGGSDRLIWVCSDAARAAGYEPATVNLTAYADEPMLLASYCLRLQHDMLQFLHGTPRAEIQFTGTLGSLLDLYETHPESSFKKLARSSSTVYAVYLNRLRRMAGSRHIDKITGLDIQAWHRVWCEPTVKGEPPRLAVGRFVANVLKAALSFGIVAGITECIRLKAVVSEISFPSPPRREFSPTREQAEAVIAAAHTINRASVALTTALQFEGTIRQWDVIGQWVPISDQRPSAVIRGKLKWIGPTWENISPDWILSITPHKTEAKTNVKVKLDLSLMPLVMREIARIPEDSRKGPLIVAETTGQPWSANTYGTAFRRCSKIAKLPDGIWSRDFRAGAVTEARRAGVSNDDIAKVAGHSSAQTTAKIYDRAELEAARRVSRGRNRKDDR